MYQNCFLKGHYQDVFAKKGRRCWDEKDDEMAVAVSTWT